MPSTSAAKRACSTSFEQAPASGQLQHVSQSHATACISTSLVLLKCAISTCSWHSGPNQSLTRVFRWLLWAMSTFDTHEAQDQRTIQINLPSCTVCAGTAAEALAFLLCMRHTVDVDHESVQESFSTYSCALWEPLDPPYHTASWQVKYRYLCRCLWRH